MWNKMHVALAVVMMTAWTMPVTADLISEVPPHDTALAARADSVNNNDGNNNRFFVGQNGNADDYNFSILRWSLASVPGGHVAITDGSLALTLLVESPGGEGEVFDGHIIDMYLINSANAGWLESNATWNELHNTNDTPWTGGPGLGNFTEGLGYGAAPIDSFTWGSPGNNGPSEFTMTIPQAVLNDWIQNPAGNAGILLRRRDETSTVHGFLRIQSSEAAIAGDRPTLTFTTAIPEPSSIWLFVIGSVALVARHRRKFH